MYKHRNCIIERTPTDSFPEMVTITQAPKLRKQFIGKRYVTLEKEHFYKLNCLNPNG